MRLTTSELLKTVRANPTVLVPDPKVDVTRFQLTATSPLGTKRGVGRGAYIDTVLAAIDGFYRTVLQDLRPWTPKAPQFPKSGSATDDAGIDTTTISPEDSTTAIEVDGPSVDLSPPTDINTVEVTWDADLRHLEQERSEAEIAIVSG